MKTARIGLLPLYIKLYDDVSPDSRRGVESFYNEAAGELSKLGLDVVKAPVCRIRDEFVEAVHNLEASDVDALVTLHLAYSPSLESATAVAASNLPVIIFDATPEYDFSPGQSPEAIMYNHGIHGVQDFCNMLIRLGKPFQIEAGHLYQSDVAKRVAALARGCAIATAMRKARVGLIGKPFDGMGDFQVPFDTLRHRIGLQVVTPDNDTLKACVAAVTDDEVSAEVKRNLSDFKSRNLDGGVHAETARVCLAVRKCIMKEQMTAFSVNFMDISDAGPITRMPFIEACRAMSEGIGYAGEGDALTAAFVGALMTQFPKTSFTEMFCPDWKNNTIFLSHMGEMNISLTAKQPVLTEMDFIYASGHNPAVVYGMFMEGEAVFANLAPGPTDSFSLIYTKGRMIGDGGKDNMPCTIRGWFDPGIPAADFLKRYSQSGGTHHGAIIYGDVRTELEAFAEAMGWKAVCIG
ncbi:MAG: hypothetical protein FWF86_02995 [Clostridia bacterium]|nr:hypothetical protein [Clostridia bacterium]